MEEIDNLEVFLKGIEAKKDYPEGLKLYLYNNQLGAEGAKALAMALQSGQCPQGVQLILSRNQIGSEGINALAMALQSGQCPQGLKFNLYDNQLGAEGAKALAMALQSGQCPQEVQFILSRNQIGSEGINALAMALQSEQCPQGLQLDLSYNQLGAEGAKALALALALQSGHCPQGFQLKFYGNQLDDEDEKILEEAWASYYADQQNKFLNCVTLYQGQVQKDSLPSLLPLEIIDKICRHILPAMPILANMTEISVKAFREQYAVLNIVDTSMHAKQLDQALETAFSSKRFTKKAAKIKTAINDFLQQELKTLEAEKVAQLPTVALLNKYHLIAGNAIESSALSRKRPPDESEGQPLLKKVRL